MPTAREFAILQVHRTLATPLGDRFSKENELFFRFRDPTYFVSLEAPEGLSLGLQAALLRRRENKEPSLLLSSGKDEGFLMLKGRAGKGEMRPHQLIEAVEQEGFRLSHTSSTAAHVPGHADHVGSVGVQVSEYVFCREVEDEKENGNRLDRLLDRLEDEKENGNSLRVGAKPQKRPRENP